MDSGLGSDEERRGRTKEQKQRHNQQLLSGCFIDAATLSDETEITDQRRNDERRQGALLFQSSIPQFSMLQMPILSASCTSIPTSASCSTDNTTPYNSIVHLDQENSSQKPSLGFYVDLSDVGEPESSEPEVSNASAKKNIFSMVIDFEAPKKDKPTCLSSSLRNGKKTKNINQDTNGKTISINDKAKCSLSTENCLKQNGSVGNDNHNDSQCSSQFNSPQLYDEARSSSIEQVQNCDEINKDEDCSETQENTCEINLKQQQQQLPKKEDESTQVIIIKLLL